MSDNYTVDIATDIIRSGHNLGTSHLLKYISFETIKSLVRDYTYKFGKPAIIMGALIWTSDVGDNYMFSIYKNEMPFDAKDLRDIM